MHLAVLAEALQIPATVGCSQGSVCDGEEALCMLLKGMCYPFVMDNTVMDYVCNHSIQGL